MTKDTEPKAKDPTRFRLVQGGDALEEARRPEYGISRYGCTKCTEETGLPYGTLIEVLTDVHERDGQIISAQKHLACNRCGERKFQVGTFIAES